MTPGEGIPDLADDVRALLDDAFTAGYRHRLLWLVAYFTFHGVDIMPIGGTKPAAVPAPVDDRDLNTDIKALLADLNNKLAAAQRRGISVVIGVEEQPTIAHPEPIRQVRVQLYRPVED